VALTLTVTITEIAVPVTICRRRPWLLVTRRLRFGGLLPQLPYLDDLSRMNGAVVRQCVSGSRPSVCQPLEYLAPALTGHRHQLRKFFRLRVRMPDVHLVPRRQ